MSQSVCVGGGGGGEETMYGVIPECFGQSSDEGHQDFRILPPPLFFSFSFFSSGVW